MMEAWFGNFREKVESTLKNLPKHVNALNYNSVIVVILAVIKKRSTLLRSTLESVFSPSVHRILSCGPEKDNAVPYADNPTL